MSSQDRRAAGLRRAWGRGPIILKLECLERRELLAASDRQLDLARPGEFRRWSPRRPSRDWGQTIEVEGRVKNQGGEHHDGALRDHDLCLAHPGNQPLFRADRLRSRSPRAWRPAKPIPYQTSVVIPATPVPDVSSSGGTLYINAVVNPAHTVAESNYHNNEDLGPPYDSVAVLIQPPTPANLVGTTLVVTPTDPTWGSTITVTAQVTNQSSGSSPQTRALLSLTPQGLTYGGSTTVGHRQHHRAPAGALPNRQPGPEHHLARRRALVDRQLHELRADDDPGCRLPHQRPLSPPARSGYRARPGGDHDHHQLDLDGHRSATSLTWPPRRCCSRSRACNGARSVQVTTEIQNLGLGAVSRVPGVLRPDRPDRLAHRRDLPGRDDDPGPCPRRQPADHPDACSSRIRLPAGVTLGSVGYARIEVLTNPENYFDESIYSNGASLSQPFIVRLPGNATTVPTTKAAGTLPSIQALAIQSQNKAKVAAAEKLAAKVAARNADETAPRNSIARSAREA